MLDRAHFLPVPQCCCTGCGAVGFVPTVSLEALVLLIVLAFPWRKMTMLTANDLWLLRMFGIFKQEWYLAAYQFGFCAP